MFEPPTYARSCCMAMLGGARAWFPAADALVFGEARFDRLARVRSQVSAEPVDVTLQWRKERELIAPQV